MRRSPLVVSVDGLGPPAGGGFCPFCGHESVERPESFSCAGGLPAACALSHLVRRLDRRTIEDEAVLIWLPELTQAAVIALVHGAHRRLAALGALHLLATGRSVAGLRERGDLAGALAVLAAFEERAVEAERRLGTTSPRLLGQALSRMTSEKYDDRARLLGGLRLLPTGRFLVNGEDHYPRLLEQTSGGRSD